MRAAGGESAAAARRRWVKAALILSAALWLLDIVYRVSNDISYVNRERCIIHKVLPRFGFLLYEYLFETLVIVFVSVFLAVLLGRCFARFAKFIPRHPVAAFLLGALVPVCSCAAVPLLSSLEGRLRFSTTMCFVLAAPLLSPHILVLSFSVLGPTYATLRILSAFTLVMVSVGVLALCRGRGPAAGAVHVCGGCSRGCSATAPDAYLETLAIFRRALPYLLIAGVVGVGLECLGPRRVLLQGGAGSGVLGVLAWIVLGMPLYFCNGAEILFLRPLLTHGFPLGTAIAFSLTSTAICTTSVAMLLRFLGARLTGVLVGSVVLVSLLLALVLNAVMS
jgi:uncharacterized membrane protein YraQ (UPF0718 family)